MASELSNLIESELKHKGFYKGGQPARREEEDDEEAPHQALMGALRVEARVKEHASIKKLLTFKRSICIGGGILLILILGLTLGMKGSKTDTSVIKVDTSAGVPTPKPTRPPITEIDYEEAELEYEEAVEEYERELERAEEAKEEYDYEEKEEALYEAYAEEAAKEAKQKAKNPLDYVADYGVDYEEEETPKSKGHRRQLRHRRD